MADSEWQVAPDSEWAVDENTGPVAPTNKQSFERGLGQGASLGWSDEIGAAIDTALQGSNPVARGVQAVRDFLGPLGRKTETPLTIKKTYEQRRDEERAANASARAENPFTYGGGTLLGALATPIPVKGGGIGSAVTRGAALGGAAGAGYSDQPGLGGVLRDTVTGALTGGLTNGILQGAGSLIQNRAAQNAPQEQARRALSQYFGKPAQSVPAPVQVNVPVLSHVGHLGVRAGEATADKGAELLSKVMTAANGGNVRAQLLLKALSATPEGAARLAGAASTSLNPGTSTSE